MSFPPADGVLPEGSSAVHLELGRFEEIFDDHRAAAEREGPACQLAAQHARLDVGRGAQQLFDVLSDDREKGAVVNAVLDDDGLDVVEERMAVTTAIASLTPASPRTAIARGSPSCARETIVS